MNFDLKDVVTFLTALSALILGIMQFRKGRAEITALDVTTFRGLVEDIKKLKRENVGVQSKIADLNKKYSALWAYVYALLDFIKQHGLVPPDPPMELETDPKIMKMIKEIEKK